ncbi:Abi-alpha family protein [Sabulicella rubraurantiaca]|uniref:Abi-alpha family protein n=1 Tax=Sabulicella rubraurantiaca TaxID=2811429 RepID=UPI001A95DDCA|nr:Abi-alpha family protein [Sabulicella rubraurantiaca]
MDETARDIAKAAGEIGKGIGKTADFGGKVVDAGTGFGGWLKDTFGTIPQDLLGVAGGDWLHYRRRMNLLQLELKTEVLREKLNENRLIEPSPSILLPLLQHAANESRDELQDLWAALLISAMHPEAYRRVRRSFFETLMKMEPLDALVFDKIIRSKTPAVNKGARKFLEEELGIRQTEVQLSMAALSNLGLLTGDQFSYVSPYGYEFWRACNPEEASV